MTHPERIVSLLCAAVEGGNNESASILSVMGVTLSGTSSALVELKKMCTTAGGNDGKDFDAVALLMTPLGAALLKLSSELVLVRQLTSNELQDPAIWEFLFELGGLAAEALGMESAISGEKLNCTVDLFIVLEGLVTTMARLNMLKEMLESQNGRDGALKTILKSARDIHSHSKTIGIEIQAEAEVTDVSFSSEHEGITGIASKSILDVEKIKDNHGGRLFKGVEEEQSLESNTNGKVTREKREMMSNHEDRYLNDCILACTERIYIALDGFLTDEPMSEGLDDIANNIKNDEHNNFFKAGKLNLAVSEKSNASSIELLDTVTGGFEAFRKTLSENTWISSTIQLQRFEMVQALEDGALEDPKSYPAACKIEWSDLVKRFVH